jgi:hypothetical protein
MADATAWLAAPACPICQETARISSAIALAESMSFLISSTLRISNFCRS